MEFQPNLSRLFENYLSNRKQFVSISNHTSPLSNVKSGVPQGSLLGPVFFNVYVNDLISLVKNTDIVLYADDSKVYFTYMPNADADIDNLQNDLSVISEWCSTNQLQLSVNKCCVLHIGTTNALRPYILNNVPLNVVTEMRDLGIVVANNLKFGSHINKMATECSRLVYLIFSAFKSRSHSFLLQTYKTFVLPKLEYNSEIWNPFLLQDIDKLERVQKLFTRKLPGLQTVNYSERLKILNLKSLEERRIVKDLIMVYKIVHGLIAIDFNLFFVPWINHGTRGHSQKIFPTQSRLDIRKYYFSNRVIPIWNSLPENIISSPNLSIFKKRVNSYNFENFLRGRTL